jgi:hypothetical protein
MMSVENWSLHDNFISCYFKILKQRSLVGNGLVCLAISWLL